MKPRRAFRWGLPLLALVAGAGLAFAIVLAALPPGGPAAPRIGGPFSLVDQDGRAVTDATFRGKWMIIYFGYTHCPDACPTALNDMAEALDNLGEKRAKVQPIFITVDPQRDTPATLRDYVAAFGAGMVGLTGTEAQVADAARAYRIYFKRKAGAASGYDMDHSSIIYVMDPQGRFVANFTQQNSPEQIAATLASLVS